MTLFAIGMRDPAALIQRARLTLAVGVAVAAASSVVLIGAQPLLAVFGPAYADQATASLRILVLAGLPLVIKTHYVASSRLQQRVRVASLIVAGGGLVELAGAAAGGRLLGLEGISLGWFVGLCVEAACMGRTVWRLAWPQRDTYPSG
jgi:Na+-driven multidrug efflux pump